MSLRPAQDYRGGVVVFIGAEFEIQFLGAGTAQPKTFDSAIIPSGSGEKPPITEVLERRTAERIGTLRYHVLSPFIDLGGEPTLNEL